MSLFKKNIIVISLFISLIQSIMSFGTVSANEPVPVYNEIKMPIVMEVENEMDLFKLKEEVINPIIIHNPNQVIGIK